MKIVIDDFKMEHLKWLMETANNMQFKIRKVKLTGDEEGVLLLKSMEEVKDEKPASEVEIREFEKWLKSASKSKNKVSILEKQLAAGQKKTWKNIKRGFEEFKMMEQGKLKARPIQELLEF